MPPGKKLGVSVTAAARPRYSFWDSLTAAEVTAGDGDAGAITGVVATRMNLSDAGFSHTRH